MSEARSKATLKNTVLCTKLCILCFNSWKVPRTVMMQVKRAHAGFNGSQPIDSTNCGALRVSRNKLDTMYRSLYLARNTGVKPQVESFQKRHNVEVATIAVHPLEKELMLTLWSLFYNRSVFCTKTYTVPRGLNEKMTYSGVQRLGPSRGYYTCTQHGAKVR